MIMNPLVSVIIPFYSGIAWLKEAVDSVFQQSFSDYEIIVVNDGSKEDDTVFLEEYGERIRYIRKANSGPGPSRNLGIREARGKYLAFLDSDDLWLPEKLKIQVEYLERTGEVWCMSTYIKFGEGMTEKLVDNSYFQRDLFPLCFYHMHFATPSVVVRKDYLEKNNLNFSETMRYGQDVFLWSNMILSGLHSIKVFSEPLVKIRMRGNGNANRRVICHLQGKAQIWEFLSKYRKNPVCPKIPVSVVFLYRWCWLGFQFWKKAGFKGKAGEIFALLMYLFPFFCFKVRYFLYRRTHDVVGA